MSAASDREMTQDLPEVIPSRRQPTIKSKPRQTSNNTSQRFTRSNSEASIPLKGSVLDVDVDAEPKLKEQDIKNFKASGLASEKADGQKSLPQGSNIAGRGTWGPKIPAKKVATNDQEKDEEDQSEVDHNLHPQQDHAFRDLEQEGQPEYSVVSFLGPPAQTHKVLVCHRLPDEMTTEHTKFTSIIDVRKDMDNLDELETLVRSSLRIPIKFKEPKNAKQGKTGEDTNADVKLSIRWQDTWLRINDLKLEIDGDVEEGLAMMIHRGFKDYFIATWSKVIIKKRGRTVETAIALEAEEVDDLLEDDGEEEADNEKEEELSEEPPAKKPKKRATTKSRMQQSKPAQQPASNKKRKRIEELELELKLAREIEEEGDDVEEDGNGQDEESEEEEEAEPPPVKKAKKGTAPKSKVQPRKPSKAPAGKRK